MDKSKSLSKVTKDLMFKEPFYGFFLIMLNKVWNEKIPTACVGKQGINYHLMINSSFWEELPHIKRIGLIKHELLHIAFKHLNVFTDFKDKKLANIAMDCEINQYIDKEWLPEGGVDIDNYPELNLDRKAGCRYYYEKMQEAQKEKEENGTSGSEAFDKMLEEGVDHSEWEQFENLSEGEQKLMDRQVETLIKEAQEQTIKKRGVIPGEIEEIIKLSVVEKPKFNWRKFIRKFTGNSLRTFTKKQRRKENHRYSDNPGLRVKMRQKMLVAIDTSASVNNDELTEFMNEIYHLYRSGVAIEIVQCDTKINSIKEYKGKFELEISGRGGTSFDPVLDYYIDNPKFTSLVYFTDGEAYTKLKPNKNILWVLSERSDMNNELPGKVIKLEI